MSTLAMHSPLKIVAAALAILSFIYTSSIQISNAHTSSEQQQSYAQIKG
jgi:hypothetical protein